MLFSIKIPLIQPTRSKVNLELALADMKLIDASYIKDIYLDRYTNIYMAFVELQELVNKDATAFNFREKITNTLQSHGLRINKLKLKKFFDGFLKDIDVLDLEIDSIDFNQTFKELDEEKKRIFDEGEKFSSESTCPF